MMPVSNHQRRRSLPNNRRGITAIVILMMVSISLAMAYAITRTQLVTTQLQSNSDLDALARQAALTGVASGLRTMSETASWHGLGSTYTSALGVGQSVTVSYTVGDPQLANTDPNWPFRVTLTSTGTATDPLHSTISATHQLQAVVQLLPCQLTAEPSNFSTMLGYTVYQYSPANFNIELPARVAGPVWLQGSLILGDDYPPLSSGANQYFSDINTMQSFGYGDNRPLSGPVNLPYNQTSSSNLSQLSLLGVSTTNTAPSTVSGWSYPGAITSYQLYPGGQTYTVPTVPSTLSSTTYAPNNQTNPLGLFYSSGNVTIGSGVTITGTLICGGDVTINGTNISLQPVNLPALSGSSLPVQLPAVVAQNNFKVSSMAQATVRGLIAAWAAFDILPGSQQTSFSLLGRVICQGFTIDDRTEWTALNGGQWNSTWTHFNNEWWSSGIYFYPLWLQVKNNLSYTPILTVAPETSPVTYHWKDATSPVYIPNPSDPGLRWTVMRWTYTF